MQITRRGIFKTTFGVTTVGLSASLRGQTAARRNASYAYVGCYTTAQRKAHGDGIHVYHVDPVTGKWSHLQRAGDLVNPSFLAVGRDQHTLYSVHGDEGFASSFSIDPGTGNITPLNRAATGGTNGVHLAFDQTGRFLVVANYSSGSVAVLPVQPDGRLSDAIQVLSLPGAPGPHRVEQSSSHPHHVVFDPSGRFVVVPDKGLDRVFTFAFDSTTGKLTPTTQGSAIARAGSGPRHAAFHPTLPVLWVLNEINSTISSYRWDAEHGHLNAVQIIPTLPADYTGESTAAEIAVSPGGRFVYCSNRGHDSVAIFSTAPRTGLLTFVGSVPSRGKTPRYIGFDPSSRFMYGTNEQSDTVITWRVDPTTGRLTETGQPIENASPVSIAFARP